MNRGSVRQNARKRDQADASAAFTALVGEEIAHPGLAKSLRRAPRPWVNYVHEGLIVGRSIHGAVARRRSISAVRSRHGTTRPREVVDRRLTSGRHHLPIASAGRAL